MTKNIIILVIFILILACGIFLYFSKSENRLNKIKSFGKANLPITRQLNWVIQEIKWQTLELSAKLSKENFNLTNSKSSLIISGKLKAESINKRPLVLKKLFISQYYALKEKKHVGVIDIYPIFEFAKKNETPPNAVFDISLEEPIQNRNWGENFFEIKMGEKTVALKTMQRK